MFSALTIANFKAFGPAQEIPLRPITLVFGPNSAGKSSIIQSLLLARHIQDTGKADAHQTTLGGAAVDLGGFARYVHKHETDREFTIRFVFGRRKIEGKFGSLDDFETLAITYTIGLTETHGLSAVASITSVSFYLDDRETIRLIRKGEGQFRVDAETVLRGTEIDFGNRFQAVDLDATLRDLDERRSPLEAEIGKYRADFQFRIVGQFDGEKFRLRGLEMEGLDPISGAVDTSKLDSESKLVEFFRGWITGWCDEDDEPS